MSNEEALFPNEEPGYCRKNCGTRLWIRKRPAGVFVIHETCPVCFLENLGKVSTKIALEQCEILIHGYRNLYINVPGKPREVRRLQNELEMVKDEILEGRATPDTRDFQHTLIKARKVLQTKMKDMVENEATSLEQLQILRADMQELQDTLETQQDICSHVRKQQDEILGQDQDCDASKDASDDSLTYSSGYALLDVLSQLEQLRTTVQEDEDIAETQHEALQDEASKLQSDLAAVQRSMSKVPGVMSNRSDSIDRLSEQFAHLQETIQKKHAEYDSNFKIQEELNNKQAHMNKSFHQQIDKLMEDVKDLQLKADPLLLRRVSALKGQLDDISAEGPKTTPASAQKSLVDIQTQVCAMRLASLTAPPILKDSNVAKVSPAHVDETESSTKVSNDSIDQAEHDRKPPACVPIVSPSSDDSIDRDYSRRFLEESNVPTAAPVATTSPTASSLSGPPAPFEEIWDPSSDDDDAEFESQSITLEAPIVEVEPDMEDLEGESEIPVATVVPIVGNAVPCDSTDDGGGNKPSQPVIQMSIPETIKQMLENQDDVDVQAMGCQNLGLLAKAGAENRAMIWERGGIELVLSTLQGPHRNDPRLLASALKALVNLGLVSAQNKTTIVNAGGVFLVIDALETHPNEIDVVKNGLIALGNWSCDATSRTVIGKSGGISLVCKALKEHQGVADIQKFGLHALNNLASFHLENRTVINNAGGIELILAAIQTHPNVTGIQRNGLSTLSRFSTGSEVFTSKIVEYGAIYLVLVSLKVHTKDAAVQQHGLLVLGNAVANNNEMKKVAIEEGALKLALDALRMHPKAPGVQRGGLFVLSAFTCRDESMDIIVEAGGLDNILLSMRRFPGDAAIQRWGCKAISELCRSSKIQKKLKNRGAAKVVTDAAEAHPHELDGYSDAALAELQKKHRGVISWGKGLAHRKN